MYEVSQILETESNDTSICEAEYDFVMTDSNKFENSMAHVSSLVIGAVSETFSKVARAAHKGAGILAVWIAPFIVSLYALLGRIIGKTRSELDAALNSIVSFGSRFTSRKSELGFIRALFLQISDIISSLRQNKNILHSAVNYVMPIAAITLLISIVTDTASVDYGISVGYNGHEIGVVSAETVINDAQKTLSERATYYDTGSLNSVTASFSIKPLSSQDEVIDETALVNIIADADLSESSEVSPIYDEQTGEAVTDDFSNTSEDKTRAYVVTVNGEKIGAVSGFYQIEQYLDSVKSEYLSGKVVSVGFEQNIEYSYEQYVAPSEVVDEQDIINIFNSHDDSYLPVLLTKELTGTKKIAFETVEIEDPDLYAGVTEIDAKGVEGEKRITALVTYKNDEAIDKEIIHEEIISQPVTEYVRVGTRATSTPVSTGSGGSGEYFWPVDGGRISAYQGDNRGHKGIDIAAPYGTPIFASESGTVIRAGNKSDGFGICIFIEQDDGNTTVYAHQSSLAITNGEYVVKGQLIGYVGSTGDSTGNHLHFEVRSSNGKALNPIDYVSQY